MPKDFLYTDQDLFEDILENEVRENIREGNTLLGAAIGAKLLGQDNDDFLIDY